ncbi:MAG TPA: 3-hydroxybutyryl-CoA dehydrogenase [Chitinophagales bacterium]|nr:3-hydroxybutyryl-CoA dehydrogenase [Chitinophagales bacterium]HMU98013.1 3-hydroxybutyryl-CoA dehydrogenase [Chitinophagales bacterium]HMV02630.1 3-hydroxybutyryl-CoA dehydrogenase [Chitinophagales bacterium]HMW94434.1 3-hydroxybutyryl-CoA dehydrogenase [Chitinophagales bacterium]HMY41503.1 3-hydroxybutyryl-CoA dehydrogenase [Chitinophagales bacterium]
MKIEQITVIGAGTMGNGIAHVCAQFGYKVNLVDVSETALDKAITTITKNLDRQLQKGSITEETKNLTLNNITINTDLKTAKNSDIVIEAASENFNIKEKIFQQLDTICKPETILASNTSSISITRIAACTNRPEKVIGMHFMNPVPVMKLVEIIKGYSTDKATTETIVTLTKQLQKTPIEANDFPGFVANRILMPMINEAIYTLNEGVSGVAEIDQIMKLGMAHPMGPLQLADFIGLDVCLSILNVLYEGFGLPKYAPCPLLVNMVTAKHLGVKTGKGFYDYSGGTKELVVSSNFS